MRRFAAAVVGLAVLVLVGCGDDGGEGGDAPSGGDDLIDVTSPAFTDGEPIPAQYTCDSDDERSPPLNWSGVPAGARAVALVVDDPDAPGGYVHWVVVDLPAGQGGLAGGDLAGEGIEIVNSSGEAAYAGPCPPSGVHHYRFTVYALAEPTDLAPDASLDDAFAAIEEQSVGQGRLVGTYERP
jgi:Raf kinase inhibitor-like YbhB/YbcL family protein